MFYLICVALKYIIIYFVVDFYFLNIFLFSCQKQAEKEQREATERVNARLRRLEAEEKVRLDNESREWIERIRACYGWEAAVCGRDEVAMDLGPTLTYPDMVADGTTSPTDDPTVKVYREVSPIADGSKEIIVPSRYNFKV